MSVLTKDAADTTDAVSCFDFADESTARQWEVVLEQLEQGMMPPVDKPRPPDSDVKRMVDWITKRAVVAQGDRDAKQGRVVLRRLNRSEYINTVRDLVQKTEDQLLEVRNFGETTLQEVRDKLTELGLHLGYRLPRSSQSRSM